MCVAANDINVRVPFLLSIVLQKLISMQFSEDERKKHTIHSDTHSNTHIHFMYSEFSGTSHCKIQLGDVIIRIELVWIFKLNSSWWEQLKIVRQFPRRNRIKNAFASAKIENDDLVRLKISTLRPCVCCSFFSIGRTNRYFVRTFHKRSSEWMGLQVPVCVCICSQHRQQSRVANVYSA